MKSRPGYSAGGARRAERGDKSVSDFLTLLIAHLELEGDEASAAAFNRALAFALDNLNARDVRCC